MKNLSVHDWGELIWLLGNIWRARFAPLIKDEYEDEEVDVRVCIDCAHDANADGKGRPELHLAM